MVDTEEIERVLDALVQRGFQYTISLHWFSTMPEADEVTAYTQLIAALCKMSKEKKRISATAKAVENE